MIQFRRNFGKTAALVAGFDSCRGEVIITMDADLQDDPEEIPHFLDKLADGYDLVSGWKKDRQDPLTKTLPSKVFNKVVSSSTGIHIHDFNNGFKAYRREVTEELKLYADLHRFIPVMATWRGFRVAEIPVKHYPRLYGKSKFGAGRFARGMLDFFKVLFLTRYMQKPLHLFGCDRCRTDRHRRDLRPLPNGGTLPHGEHRGAAAAGSRRAAGDHRSAAVQPGLDRRNAPPCLLPASRGI